MFEFGTLVDTIKGVMKKILNILFLLTAASAVGQRSLSMEECMDYAVKHASSVRQARWDLATANANSNQATADFFPSVSAQVGGQFSWGRNIDPETNSYNNVTTFNNSYGVYASLTIFDGGQTFNRFKQARAEKERSRNRIALEQDDKAIATMLAFVDAVYYKKSIGIAADKLAQSREMLTLTRRQEELGIKGHPDLAQALATVADDEYNLVHQQNLYSQAMLTLKSAMNFPMVDTLMVDTVSMSCRNREPEITDVESIYIYALSCNPRALDADMMVKSSNYQHRVAKGELSPTIRLNGGLSTSYYKTLTGGNTARGFSEQFKNNLGEYVSATLSIPLFSNLSRISSVKKSRYALEKAKIEREEIFRKLHDDIMAAVMDRDGYAMEIKSLEFKVDADGEAYRLNRRKYEEGIVSLIDLQLSANTFFSSRLTLLQKQMLYILKDKLVDYYKGQPLYTMSSH